VKEEYKSPFLFNKLMQRDSLIFEEFSLVYSGNDVEEIMTSSSDFGN
jgi:hypothetical protein